MIAILCVIIIPMTLLIVVALLNDYCPLIIFLSVVTINHCFSIFLAVNDAICRKQELGFRE